MAASTAGQSFVPDGITKSQFDAALELYPSLIAKVSEQKKGKDAAKRTLLDLDKLRFETLPKKYSGSIAAAPKPLEKEDVVTLVEWKLKHGTFRPALLAMARNNEASQYQETTTTAFSSYQEDKSTKAAIKALSAIKGIGPATASLLLSIHDPDHVIFFSDEAFLWFCKGGSMEKKKEIKYNAKEYEELDEKAKKLMKRLGVGAREVEQVAFVLLRDGDVKSIIQKKEEAGEKNGDTGKKEKPKEEKKEDGIGATEKKSSKRKAAKAPEPPTGSRSSQRSKKPKN